MKKGKIILPTVTAAIAAPLINLVGCSKEDFILLNNPVYHKDHCQAITTSSPMSFEVGKQYQFRFDMYKFDSEIGISGPSDEIYGLFTFQDEINYIVRVDVNIDLVKFNGQTFQEGEDEERGPGYYYISEHDDIGELSLKGNFTKPSDSLIISLTPNQPIENLYVEFECD